MIRKNIRPFVVDFSSYNYYDYQKLINRSIVGEDGTPVILRLSFIFMNYSSCCEKYNKVLGRLSFAKYKYLNKHDSVEAPFFPTWPEPLIRKYFEKKI